MHENETTAESGTGCREVGGTVAGARLRREWQVGVYRNGGIYIVEGSFFAHFLLQVQQDRLLVGD